MVRFKNNILRDEFNNSNEDIETFANSRKLYWIKVKASDDGLFIKNNFGEMQMDKDGLVDVGKGTYEKFSENNGKIINLDELDNQINEDLKSIDNSKWDIVSIN